VIPFDLHIGEARLGLSICHTIIHGHGGRIRAEPSKLGGNAFHFTLIDVSGG
jgi:two-component system sensor kinase FixL